MAGPPSFHGQSPPSGDQTIPFLEDDEPEPMSFAPRHLRLSAPPPSTRHPEIQFEAVSARFRHLSSYQRNATMRFPREEAQALITSVSDRLRLRAIELPEPNERARMTGFALSIDKLLESPVARSYLWRPEISRDLSTYLRRYEAVATAQGDHPNIRDIVLKSSVSAIHIAPCLGYWRSCSIVPEEVKPFLSAENVFGSVFRIAKERRPAWVDRLLTRYTTITTNLSTTTGKDGALPLKTRNSVLWPWCKFNIRNVTYEFHRHNAALAEVEEDIVDIKLVLVLLNVLLDDLADCLQDAPLLAVFLEIPSAGGELDVASPDDYARLRGRLAELGYPHFEEYFDLAVDCWVESIKRLRQAVGAAFDHCRSHLERDYKLLLGAMRFSADVNTSTQEIFETSPEALEERYGCATFGDLLAHNANRAVFFTIDEMCLRAFDPEQYDNMSLSGVLETYRETAWIFQEMQQIGNSLATGARETESDDLSNELFKIANDRLNTVDDWPFPPHLATVPGVSRKDAVLRAFELKKVAARARRAHPEGSPEHESAKTEYFALANDIESMVSMSGAEQYYFEHWYELREKALDLLYRCGEWLDRYRLVGANDLVLVLHLTYKGRL